MAFAGTLMVALRESLEAMLVCGILIGIVTKLGKPEARQPILLGALAGLVASVAVGWGVYVFADGLSGTAQQAFEAIAGLTAVAVLTYMVVWMYRHTMQTVGGLHEKAKAALLSGRNGVLLSLAFVMVVREGIETVLFVAPTMATSSPLSILAAVGAGMAIAFVLAYLLFKGTFRLSVEKFFAVTGALLVVFGGSMLVYSLHELHELMEPADTWNVVLWNTGFSHGSGLGALLSATIGYRQAPRLLEVAGYLLYVGGLGAWYLRPAISAWLARRAQATSAQ